VTSESEGIGVTLEFIEAEGGELADEVTDLGRRVAAFAKRDLVSRDGYLVVLIMVVLTVVMLAVDDSYTGGAVVSAAVMGLLVLITLSRSHVSHTLRLFGAFVTGTALVCAVVAQIRGDLPVVSGSTRPPDAVLLAIGSGAYLVVLALLFPAILRQGFTHRTINLNTVAAALSAYLLLGLIFANACRFVQIVAPPMFAQSQVNGFTYTYFSYVTLTSVGYGDFTPANDAGRTLAILEALFGQVFLVTIVAMVVSNLGREHSPMFRRTAASPDRAPGQPDLTPPTTPPQDTPR
jgi:voltage-gated potassium channel Kch